MTAIGPQWADGRRRASEVVPRQSMPCSAVSGRLLTATGRFPALGQGAHRVPGHGKSPAGSSAGASSRSRVSQRDRRPGADVDPVPVGQSHGRARVGGDGRRIVVDRRAVHGTKVADRVRAVGLAFENGVFVRDRRILGCPGEVDLDRVPRRLSVVAPDPDVVGGQREAPLDVGVRKRDAGRRETVELGAVSARDRFPQRRPRRGALEVVAARFAIAVVAVARGSALRARFARRRCGSLTGRCRAALTRGRRAASPAGAAPPSPAGATDISEVAGAGAALIGTPHWSQ